MFGYTSGEEIYRTRIGWVGIYRGIACYAGGFAGSTTEECMIVKDYKKYMRSSRWFEQEDILRRWTGSSIPKNVEKVLLNIIIKQSKIKEE